MTQLSGFPPVGNRNGRILILGTMPGTASLLAQEYYAHPQNSFWPIMGVLVGAGRDLAYQARLRIISNADITLWNVLEFCSREGSLDSAIRDEIPYDFKSFFAAQPRFTHIFFNGQKAAQSFRRRVLPVLTQSFILHDLPSTSPAHARLNFAGKLAAWRMICDI